jgi:hypothetical protein
MPTAYCPGDGSSIRNFPAFRREELVGNLKQYTGAITGVLLTAAGPAMFKVQQNLNRFLYYVVRLASLNVDDEARTTSIMLAVWVI